MGTPVNVESADQQALAAVRDHHAGLRRELDDHVTALRTAVRTDAPYQRQLAALRGFVDGSLLPHAAAEEATLYPAGATGAPLLVEAMVAEHRALADRAGALAGAHSSVEALAAAEGLAAVFAVHVDKENELLLPLLIRTAGVSVAGLVRAMHDWPAQPENAEHSGAGDAQEELDVRTLPHGGGRHEAIFARLETLGPGGRLVIVNDHDPRPLRSQLVATWPDTFTWDYLQAGPQVWRVAITRRV